MSEGRVLELIAGAVPRYHAEAAAIVAAVRHPAVVRKTIENALHDSATKEGQLLFSAMGSLRMGGRTSHVRLNDGALSSRLRLHERILETGYVCGGSAGTTDWFEDCLSTAGITGLSWRCLRHTFASRLVMAGADPRTVAELLRDKTLHIA